MITGRAPALDLAADTASTLFSAVADPRRRRLLEALVRGPQAVNSLALRCRLSRAIAVHHLQVLQRAGMVRLSAGRAAVRPEGLAALRRYVDAALTLASISAPFR